MGKQGTDSTNSENGTYWGERMSGLEEEQHQRGEAYYQDLQEQFRRAKNEIQMDIERWYQRLAENNEVSLVAAKRLLKKKELEEFQWTVEQYIKYGEKNALDPKWKKQLENASARHHISYLEALKCQMQQHVEQLMTEYEGGVTDFLHKTYAENYYHSAYEIAKGTGVGSNFAQLDEKRIDVIIKKPWAQDGKKFSDRIWTNKQKLTSHLHTELSQCIIRGDEPAKAISRLSEIMDVSERQAGRLVMTEAAAISSVARKDCFQELDVEEFQFVATLDRHTSELCQSMDGKHFKMSEYQIGVNVPPLHCWCRSCTVPYFGDEFTEGEQRAARDEDGKTYYVPANMTYKEWEKTFINGEDKSKTESILQVEKEVEKYSDHAIMKLSEEEMGVLLKYKSFEAYEINEALRTVNGDIEKLSSIQQSFVNKLDTALSKIPKYSGNLIRTINFSGWSDCSERTEEFLGKFIEGTIITIDQYWSTSKQFGYDDKAGIWIYIQNSQKGRDISMVGLDEQEVLYERKFQFVVISKVFYDGIWYILLEEM